MKGILLNKKWMQNVPDEMVHLFPQYEIADSYDVELDYVKPILSDGIYIEGATPEEIEAIEDSKYPITITALQFKLELIYSGIKNQVELVLDSLNEPEKTIAWLKYDKATEFDRKDQLIQSLGMAIGYTKTDINDFFLRASNR